MALRFITFLILILAVSILFQLEPAFSETAISERSLSTDIVVKQVYEPGSGLPVGKIQSVQGEAIVFHRDPAVGYRLEIGMPLYAGDIMSTSGSARILCRLIDGSSIVMTPETTLTIIQSSYNSFRKSGISFLYLQHGGARFKLNPPADLSSYDFKVQTETAFTQTREADFVVKTEPEATDIIAFENSRLEVAGMAQPEDITYLSGLQKTFISGDIISPTVETLSTEEHEAFMTDFHSAPRSILFADKADARADDDISQGTTKGVSEEMPEETPSESLVEEEIVETELTE